MHSEIQYFNGLLVLLVVLLVGCGTALYIPAQNQALRDNDLPEMKKGRADYISHCGSCHTLYLPEKYQPSEWKVHLGNMAKKAHLSEAEKNAIIKYLTKNKLSTLDSVPCR